MPFTCSSQVVKVIVHARGALVTRRVHVPGELPEGDVDLIVPGVTLLAEGGSVRAALSGSARTVVSVQAAVFVPEEQVTAGPSVEQVRAVTSRLGRLQAEKEHLFARRKELSALMPSPALRATSLLERVDERTEDALQSAALLEEELGRLDERLFTLEDEEREVERQRDAAVLKDRQQSSTERAGTGQPSRRVCVRISGSGPIAAMEVTYVVPAARWWPIYTLRLSEGGKRATWWLEALLAQQSGEDWTAVQLSLSTADLIYDARLPELPSLRLGKAQPPSRRGYRPLPEGLSRMFAGYDRAFPQGTTGAPAPQVGAPKGAPRDLPGKEAYMSLAESDLSETTDQSAAFDGMSPQAAAYDDMEGGGGMNLRRSGGPPPPPRPGGHAAAPTAPMSIAMPSFGAGAPPPAAMQAAAPMRTRSMLAGSLALGGARGEPPTGRYQAVPAEPEPLPDPDLSPGDSWLDFDSLRLAHADDQRRRGHLVKCDDDRYGALQKSSIDRIQSLSPQKGVSDPQSSRGLFDHRYDSEGPADVPSDGQAHRLMLGQSETSATVHFRTVPREAAEVYREVELVNPFDAPLLSGPVDVYVEGSLLCTASVPGIDRGGTMQVGMGVEERIRVARNVRAEEESAGLLGGSTAVSHAVTIELSSALSTPAPVEVLECLPVSDDRSVEIERVLLKPEPSPYNQAERGFAVRGGQRWTIQLPPGGKALIECRYRLIFPAKSEIVGGNRRD